LSLVTPLVHRFRKLNAAAAQLIRKLRLEANGASPGVYVLERFRQPAHPLVQAVAGERARSDDARRPVLEVVQPQALPHFGRAHRPFLRQQKCRDQMMYKRDADAWVPSRARVFVGQALSLIAVLSK
jgi:hypothetical protein